MGNVLESRLSIYKNKLHVLVSLKLLTCTCGGIHHDGLSRYTQFDRPHLEWRHSKLNGPAQAHYKLSYSHFSFFRCRRLTAWRGVCINRCCLRFRLASSLHAPHATWFAQKEVPGQLTFGMSQSGIKLAEPCLDGALVWRR